MSDSFYTIRNYQPADFDKYVRLRKVEAERLEPTGYRISSQVIAEDVGRPNYSPEQDLFIVETDEDMVGYMDSTLELSIGRVILNGFVHPDHRRKGLASKLLGYATHRAKEPGAKVAHVRIPRDNVVAKGVLSRLGFRFVRRFLELSLDLSRVHGQDIDQTTLHCRQLQHGEEDKLTQLQNRSFAGTWGYNPNTVEEITYRTNLSNCSPEDVILACDGDKPVGYCWTRKSCKVAPGERTGQIPMLGVDPDYRGRGVGKGVLLAGLSYLKNRDLRFVDLTVDSENQAACALYRSVGFKLQASTLWYQKATG